MCLAAAISQGSVFKVTIAFGREELISAQRKEPGCWFQARLKNVGGNQPHFTQD